MTDAEYIHAGGTTCPFCSADDPKYIRKTGHTDCDKDGFTITKECDVCESTWLETWTSDGKLSGYISGTELELQG